MSDIWLRPTTSMRCWLLTRSVAIPYFHMVVDKEAQLKQVMDEGVAFSEYTEGPLLFKPTYKYDLGTDNYDSTEKARIPAWTGECTRGHLSIVNSKPLPDRILFKGDALDLSVYSRAELKGSDHRPGAFARMRCCTEEHV